MRLSILGAFAVVAALLFFAGSASGVSPVYAIPEDACGNDIVDVPDTGATFDFVKACLTHDDCYFEGGTESDRRACDAEFLSNMRYSCDLMWPDQFFKRRACLTVAYTYYLGVSIGGWAFFPYGEQNPF